MYIFTQKLNRLVSFYVRNMQIFRGDLRIFITIILLNIDYRIDINLLLRKIMGIHIMFEVGKVSN